MEIPTLARRKQKYLVPLLTLVAFATIFFGWYSFFFKPKPQILPPPPPKEIKINFQVLETPILKEFQLFEEILPFEGEIGRENPFVPY